jgi:hypothetical protein
MTLCVPYMSPDTSSNSVTEPQPHAMRQVAVCCFDKTGTLTSDDMVLEGLAGLPGHGYNLLREIKEAGIATLRVLAGCHALIYVDGELMGDPLERATFQATGKPSLLSFLLLVKLSLPIFSLLVGPSAAEYAPNAPSHVTSCVACHITLLQSDNTM